MLHTAQHITGTTLLQPKTKHWWADVFESKHREPTYSRRWGKNERYLAGTQTDRDIMQAYRHPSISKKGTSASLTTVKRRLATKFRVTDYLLLALSYRFFLMIVFLIPTCRPTAPWPLTVPPSVSDQLRSCLKHDLDTACERSSCMLEWENPRREIRTQ